VEFRHFEVNIATQQFHNADGWSGTVMQWDINYGALPDLQLNLLPAVAYDKTPGQPARFGWGDTEAGFKYRFLHETDSCPQAAIYPIAVLPTGNHNEGLGNGKTQLFLPIWLQKSWGDWTTFGGGGYWFHPGPDNRDYWYAGWVLQRKITASFAPGLEIQFQTPDSVGAHCSTALNAGGTWDLSETYHLLFSAGHTIQGQSEFQGYLGLQITWGPKEKDKK
jgi:hypothetical protein